MRPSKLHIGLLGLGLTLMGLVLAQQNSQPPAAMPGMPMNGMSMNGSSMMNHGGVPGAASPALQSTVPQLRVDQTLRLAVPYTPDTHLPDDYRCFVLDPQLTGDRTLTGYEVHPQNPGVVHHAILDIAMPDEVAGVRALDGADGRPGWSCFGGTGLRSDGGADTDASAVERAAQSMGVGGLGIGSWTPGSTATLFPAGTGRRVPKGSLFVIQMHYNTALGHQPDQSSVDLQYAPPGARLTPLRDLTVIAPVELPCPAAQAGDPACNRDAAVRAGIAKYGPGAGALPEALLSFCGRTLKDYAGQRADRVTSSCDLPVTADATAYGAILHMHTHGTAISLTLNPGKPGEQTLLDIPKWDFHWQGSYWYQQPIALHRGDRLRLSCTWDNSRDPKPRYIVWGEGTADEMCLGSVTVTVP